MESSVCNELLKQLQKFLYTILMQHDSHEWIATKNNRLKCTVNYEYVLIWIAYVGKKVGGKVVTNLKCLPVYLNQTVLIKKHEFLYTDDGAQAHTMKIGDFRLP
jgi:hypothetical protein